MGTIAPTKMNKLECNHAREEFRSSKRLNGNEEIGEKKLAYGNTCRRGSQG